MIVIVLVLVVSDCSTKHTIVHYKERTQHTNSDLKSRREKRYIFTYSHIRIFAYRLIHL